MNRRSFIRNSAFTAAAMTLAQQQILAAFVEDPWKITMLNDTLGIFTERGGTIAFLLAKKEIVVVDSQFPDQSQHLITELKKKSDQSFSTLINTHHHGDHTAGNISFKGIVNHVVAHANSLVNQKNVAVANKSEEKQLYPDQTYTDTWCQKAGNEKICLHYFGAGHTNGDSLVHFQHSNIVHMGDLVFNRRHPYIDRGAGANIHSWIEVLNKAVKTFDAKTTFISGHSGNGYDVVMKADALTAFGDYLGKVLQFVEGEIKAGKTKEEILKNTAIPGADQWKGDGIKRPLTAAYEELTVKS